MFMLIWAARVPGWCAEWVSVVARSRPDVVRELVLKADSAIVVSKLWPAEAALNPVFCREDERGA